MANQYVNSVAYAAIPQWSSSTVFAPGAFVRQLTAPGLGGERVFRTALGGTSGTTEPVWAVSTGAVNPIADGTITDWTEVTGNPTYNWAAPHAGIQGALTFECRGSTIPAAATGWAVGDYCQTTTQTLAGCPVIMRVTAVNAGRPTALALVSGGAFSSNPFAGNISANWTALTGVGSGYTAFYSSASGLQHAGAGDTIYVSSNHNQVNTAGISLIFSGTLASPNFVLCVNEAGSVPPVEADLRTTATLSTIGNFGITTSGTAYIYGLTFNAGSGSGTAGVGLNNSANSNWQKFENCVFKKNTTSAGVISLGSTINNSTQTELVNCTVQFGSISDLLQVWSRNTTIRNVAGQTFVQGAIIPTVLFANQAGNLLVENVDLSASGAGKTVLAGWSYKAIIKDCKLGAGVTVSGTPSLPGSEALLLRSDSSATSYRNEKYSYPGNQTVETTIVRSDGASDGAQPISWRVTTSANAKPFLPFECTPIARWNEKTSGSITFTVEGVWSGPGLPQNDDIWIDAEYLGSSNTLGQVASSGKLTLLSPGASQQSSSASWDALPATPVKFTASVTIPAPASAGFVYLYIKAGKPSATFYIDPHVTVS